MRWWSCCLVIAAQGVCIALMAKCAPIVSSSCAGYGEAQAKTLAFLLIGLSPFGPFSLFLTVGLKAYGLFGAASTKAELYRRIKAGGYPEMFLVWKSAREKFVAQYERSAR